MQKLPYLNLYRQYINYILNSSIKWNTFLSEIIKWKLYSIFPFIILNVYASHLHTVLWNTVLYISHILVVAKHIILKIINTGLYSNNTSHNMHSKLVWQMTEGANFQISRSIYLSLWCPRKCFKSRKLGLKALLFSADMQDDW